MNVLHGGIVFAFARAAVYLRRNSAQRQHQANRRGQRQRGLLEANSAGHGAITQRNSARFRFRRALSLAGSRRPAGLQASPRRAAAEGACHVCSVG